MALAIRMHAFARKFYAPFGPCWPGELYFEHISIIRALVETMRPGDNDIKGAKSSGYRQVAAKAGQTRTNTSARCPDMIWPVDPSFFDPRSDHSFQHRTGLRILETYSPKRYVQPHHLHHEPHQQPTSTQ